MAIGTRDWAQVDFYASLGVAADATEDDIGRAYRLLAKQLHPDAGATAQQIERFKEVSAAHAVLRDAKLRRDYDLVRGEAQRQAMHTTADPVRPRPGVRPVGAFRSAKPARGWSRSRSWMAALGGILVTVLGAVVTVAVVALQMRNNDPGAQPDAARDITLAIVALKLLICGPVFTILGVMHLRGRSLPRFVVLSR